MEVEWNLRLIRVVIEDGNPEICSGDVFEWGVDFQCEALLTIALEKETRAVLVEKNCYRVHAKVIYISKDPRYDCCVLDFGITALSESGAAVRRVFAVLSGRNETARTQLPSARSGRCGRARRGSGA